MLRITKIILVGSALLVSLVPTATADVSILGGTVVVHTSGDPGVSSLGDPVARVAVNQPCYSDYTCTFVYGDPAGLADYQLVVIAGSPCNAFNARASCFLVDLSLPTGSVGAGVLLGDDASFLAVCAGLVTLATVGDCVVVETDPLCVYDLLVGEIVCET